MNKSLATIGLASYLLSGCASLGLDQIGKTVGPDYQRPEAKTLVISEQWQGPLPTQANAVAPSDWWISFNDPALSQLIAAGLKANPNLRATLARIEAARAGLRIAGGGAAPQFDFGGSGQRQSQLASPASSVLQLGVSAGWELDLFGGNRRGINAAQAQVESAQADWHAARLSLVSDIATLYVALRTTEANLGVQELDVISQTKTLELTTLKVQTGFSAPAEASLLRASLANSRNQLTSLKSDRQILINSLSILTGDTTAAIESRAKSGYGQLPKPAAFSINLLPAQLLVQRPDILALERLLQASTEQVGVAIANQYPKISLSGNFGFGSARSMSSTTDGIFWGFGPAISIPLFDSGRRAAGVDSAKSRLEETQSLVELKLRAAVAEAQEAMLRLSSAQEREGNALTAVADFEAFYKAAETRWRVGVGSLLELEEARRLAANAKIALLRLEQDRINQWIALHKAIGGGWNQETLSQTPATIK
jgi:outer membrane protein, multidrug efflux system